MGLLDKLRSAKAKVEEAKEAQAGLMNKAKAAGKNLVAYAKETKDLVRERHENLVQLKKAKREVGIEVTQVADAAAELEKAAYEIGEEVLAEAAVAVRNGVEGAKETMNEVLIELGRAPIQDPPVDEPKKVEIPDEPTPDEEEEEDEYDEYDDDSEADEEEDDEA